MYNIVVVGDIIVDLLKKDKKTISMTKQFEKERWEIYYGRFFETQNIIGGAILLADMITESVGDKNVVFTHDKKETEDNYKNLVHTITTLGEFKTRINEDEYSEKAIKNRIKKYDGFEFPKEEKIDIDKPNVNYKDLKGEVDMVVIHDAGNYFRKNEGNFWEKQIIEKTKDDAIFIHKMSYPLVNGSLWEEISEIKENLIVIILAEDLREQGLRISRNLSWERSAFDLRSRIEDIRCERIDNPKLKQLFDLKNLNLIIRFELEGAVLYQNAEDPKKDKYTLLFDPEVLEGNLMFKYPGKMKVFGLAFVSGLVMGIRNNIGNLDQRIKDGIKKGIIASYRVYEYGFVIDEIGNVKYPFKDIFSNLEGNEIQEVEIINDVNWKIIDETLQKEEDIYQVACQIVKYGKSQKLKAPFIEFGQLRSADRGEIESYHSLRNLINEYINKNNVNEPLSIAVFGPPGSGKSFGVTQIAKTISKNIQKLEFNLSQFKSPKDLFNAFHIIQSTSLNGKTPLVFFDEFDSHLDNIPYGWLKYFLSPMNDGKFKQGDIVHPIGKCIFVFAGGTKKTFSDFENDKNKHKGSDFISRLRGYVNIVGINSENYEDYSSFINDEWFRRLHLRKLRINWKNKRDNHYLIRRAMVLRTLLERHAPNIFEIINGKKIAQIDDSILTALIKVPTYRHGNRSIEAIIEMSILSNRKRFDRSALPSSQQLQLHVDAEKFKEYLNGTVICREPLIFGEDLEYYKEIYSSIIDSVYNSNRLDKEVKKNLDLESMIKGVNPDGKFYNFELHQYSLSWSEAKKWLDKAKCHYIQEDYEPASYCFGVASHFITDTLSAPHCTNKELIKEDHSKFVEIARNITPKPVLIEGELDVIIKEGYLREKMTWEEWMKDKKEIKVYASFNKVASVVLTAITYYTSNL